MQLTWQLAPIFQYLKKLSRCHEDFDIFKKREVDVNSDCLFILKGLRR